jgi:hypothetical protein
MLPAAAAVVTTSAVTAMKAVPTLSETSMGVYALVRNFYTTQDFGIAERLKHMDLDARAKVIEALVHDLDGLDTPRSSSISVARELLRETMSELHTSLENLKASMRTYKHAYFATWRYGAQLEQEMHHVSNLSHILRKRTFLLVQILPLAKGQ